MKSELVATDRITVLPFIERPHNKVADDRDRESIKNSGIQQPLIGVVDGERILLAKGLRRLRFAISLGIGKVPMIFVPIPKGYYVDTYIRELRLALDMHRQDLLPSQKCSLVEELKTRFKMTNRQVAAYLGIDPDSVTNWLAVRSYVPAVVTALDSGRLTMQAARVFDGMSEQGQEHVWKKHSEDLSNGSGAAAHKEIRTKYSPTEFPKYYRNPELVKTRLAQGSGPRKSKTRPTITSQEKRRLSSSLDMKEIELREGAAEEALLKRQITAAIAPLSAIMRDAKLFAIVPEEMRDEIDRFAEIYI